MGWAGGELSQVQVLHLTTTDMDSNVMIFAWLTLAKAWLIALTCIVKKIYVCNIKTNSKMYVYF